MRKRLSFVTGIVAVALAGWSAGPAVSLCLERTAVDRTIPVLRRTQAELQKSRTPRAVREAVPGLLATVDGLVATSPENAELLELAAQGATTFAFTFLEEEDPKRATELYERAHGYALRALAVRNKALLAAVLSRVDEKPRLDPIAETEVPALFWLGFAWGSQINLNRTDEKLLGQLGQVDRVMQAVLEKDESFFHGGPHLYFGVRYAVLSKSLGGDPERARRHFEAVDRLTQGRHLFARLLRAQYFSSSLQVVPAGASREAALAARTAAWEDFYFTLCGIVDAPDDLWPEERLANEVAKERASRLAARPSDANVLPPKGAENRFAAKTEED
jgi:hypothetical protein